MYELRKATIEDAKLLFEWANDDEVRATAIIKKKITWDEHINWLANKLRNNQSHIYILTENNNVNIGVVRFDQKDDTFVISYSIDNLHRKKGMGHLILQLGLEKMGKIAPKSKFKGSVQKDNMASNKIFEKLGFRIEKTEVIEEHIFNIYFKDENE